MALAAAVMAMALALCGCANVTTTRIMRSANGQIIISSGKDVKIEKLHYSYSPVDGTVEVVMSGYSSNANTDAINAQAQREQQVINGVITAVQLGAKAAVLP